VTLATDFAWQTFADLLDPPENRYAQDPVGWVRDRLLGQLHGGSIREKTRSQTTTAPTTKQVHAILWRYIDQAHRKGNLPGRIPLDYEWYMGPGGKSSSPLAASKLITINRRFRASMR
jgi:hypothetical protein